MMRAWPEQRDLTAIRLPGSLAIKWMCHAPPGDVGPALPRDALRHRLRAGGPWRWPAARCLHGRDGDADDCPAADGGPAVRGPRQRDYGPGGRALSPHPGSGLRGSPTSWMPASRRRRDAAFVAALAPGMPGRVVPFGPLRYALPVRAVADTVRRLDSLREVRRSWPMPSSGAVCAVPDLVAELTAGPNIGSTTFPRGADRCRRRDQVGRRGDLKDLLTRSGLPMPLFNPLVFAGGAVHRQPGRMVARARLAIEVDSREWHLSARGPRQYPDSRQAHGHPPAQRAPVHPPADPPERRPVVAEIRAVVADAARGRPPLNLRTVPRPASSPGQPGRPA